MSQLDASLRVASPTSIEHSWMFCRSTVKQHSQQREQKMCTRPRLRPPGRECTELRDHLEHGFSVPTSPRKKQSMFEWLGCDATVALLCSKHWTTCLEYRFRVPKHINLLEAEELVSLVRRQVDTGMRSRRVLVAADSCVSMSALVKGRSNSHTLNDIRKQLCKLCLFANSVMGKSVRRALTLSACRVLAGGASCAAVGPVHCTSPRSRVPRSWAGVWVRRPPRFSGSASLTTLVQSWPCCAVCSSQSGRDGCRLHSLGGAALTGICGTRLGYAPQRDPRCGRLRPPDLQGRDLRFAPFMSNRHVRSSNEDLGSSSWSPLSVLGPWFHEGKQRVTSPFFSSCRKLFVHMGVCLPTKAFDLFDDLDLWRSTVSRVRHLDINVVPICFQAGASVCIVLHV